MTFKHKRPRADQFIAENIHRFCIVGAFFILAILPFTTRGIDSISVLFPTGLVLLGFSARAFMKKFICEIEIDSLSQRIHYRLFVSQEYHKMSFEEIESILVNGYIFVKTKSTTLLLWDTQDIEMLRCLNRIKPIEWGKLVLVFGPSRSVRQEIMRSKP